MVETNRMNNMILSWCLLCMFYSISVSETDGAEVTDDCNVTIGLSRDTEFPTVILESEQSYYSNTNGRSYRRVPIFVAGKARES